MEEVSREDENQGAPAQEVKLEEASKEDENQGASTQHEVLPVIVSTEEVSL